jgi:hypothetical protein
MPDNHDTHVVLEAARGKLDQSHEPVGRLLDVSPANRCRDLRRRRILEETVRRDKQRAI